MKKLNIGSLKRLLSLYYIFRNKNQTSVETKIKSKKEIKSFIRQELATILVSVNPAIDKRDFKKSIGKAEKILLKGASKRRKKNSPVQVEYNEEVIIRSAQQMDHTIEE